MNNTDINDQDLSIPSIWTHIETSTESVKKINFSCKEQLSKLCFIFPPLISGFLDPHTTFWGPCFQVPPNILNSAQFLIIPHPVTKSHLKLHDPIQHLGPHTTFRSSTQHYVIPCHVSGPTQHFAILNHMARPHATFSGST